MHFKLKVAGTSFLTRGAGHYRLSRARDTRERGARFKRQNFKTNMAACGFFRARLFLSCFKRNSLISGSVSTRTTLDNPLYPRQIVSRVQCSSFKGKTAIDRDGDWERKDSQNGYKNGELTNFSKLSRLIVLATFCVFYFVCSTTTAYAGEGDEDKQDYEFRRHKGCFASKRLIQCVKNLATAKKCRIQTKENQPEEGNDCEPPRKIQTRSQQVCCVCVTPLKLLQMLQISWIHCYGSLPSFCFIVFFEELNT